MKKIVTNISLSIISIIISLTLVEFLLPVFIPRHPSWSFFEENPNGTGSYRLQKNYRNSYNCHFFIRTNSLGMPWKEVSYNNPENKVRIAFVGDSFTFGCWADRFEHSFVGTFDSLLDHRHFESLNFGVPGYGNADEELIIKEEVIKFHPQYIILGSFVDDYARTYLGGRILTGSSKTPNWDLRTVKKLVPKELIPPDDDRYQEKGSNDKGFDLKSFITRLNIYRLINKWNKDDEVLNRPFRADRNNFFAESFWCQKDYPPVAVKAKDSSLTVLGRINDYCIQHHIKLIVVSIPLKAQVFAPSWSGDDWDIHYPQKYVEDFCSVHKIPYLNLLNFLRSFVQQNKEKLFLLNDDHFNNNGHAVVGLEIFKFFNRIRGASSLKQNQ